MNWNEFQKWSAALCAYREARGEGEDGIRAVLHVIKNRADKWGKSWAQIIYQPLQFSSMTFPHDPQLSLVPRIPDPIFERCYELADSIFQGKDFDLTSGATHYYATTIKAPDWSTKMKEVARVGRQIFYAEVV